jgi:hypothetical protein
MALRGGGAMCAIIHVIQPPHLGQGAPIVGRPSQNGPTFTNAPPKKRRLADEERPVRPDPKIAEDEKKRLTAKKRRRLKLAHGIHAPGYRNQRCFRRRTSRPLDPCTTLGRPRWCAIVPCLILWRLRASFHDRAIK